MKNAFRHYAFPCSRVCANQLSGVSEPVCVIDSGASCHCFGNEASFVPGSLQPCDVQVHVVGGVTKAKQKGDVRLRLANRGQTSVLLLKDVLLMPGLKVDLLSAKCLLEKGCRLSMSNAACSVVGPDGRTVLVAKLSKVSGLFEVPLMSGGARGKQMISLAATHTANLPDADLWHRRMGHCADNYLSAISPKFAKTPLSFCDACVYAKSHRRPFRHQTSEAVFTKPLDSVVSDLCGPMEVQSRKKKRYFATVIDVVSKYVWVFFLRNKNKLCECLEGWFTMVKTQLGSVPKNFHADNGTEYTAGETRAIFELAGTVFTTTSPDNPNMNAAAERMNRTLLESALAMMFQAGAPKSLWEEAVRYAVYLRNRTPHKGLAMKSPAEVIPLPMLKKQQQTGKLYEHVKTWGCEAWLHVHKNHRRKLSKKAVRCVFVGVDDERKGYRLLTVDGRRLVISRDVHFNKSVFPMRDPSPELERGEEKGSRNASLGGSVDSVDSVGSVDSVDSDLPVSVSDTDGDLPELVYSSDSDSDAGSDSDGDEDDGNGMPAVAARRSARAREPSGQSLRNVAGGDSAYHCAFSSVRRAKRAKKSKDPNVPSTFKQAKQSPEETKWSHAMQDEYDSLVRNDTWIEVPESEAVASGTTILTCRWVFDLKRNADGNVVRYKARLTARGFMQKYGIDYTDTYASVAQLKSFRLLMAIAVVRDLDVYAYDISCAFTYAPLKEQVYMRAPEGFPSSPGTVLLLKKALYGLKNAPKAWQETLMKVFVAAGFIRMLNDQCVLRRGDSFLLVWVDDILCFTSDLAVHLEVTGILESHFKTSDLGAVELYLGIQIERTEDTIMLHQSTYVARILERFGMSAAKPGPVPAVCQLPVQLAHDASGENFDKSVPYREAVGSLWYAANCTRPDITFATNAVAQYSQSYGTVQWTAVKRIFRYLCGTVNRGIVFTKSKGLQIVTYCDSDWGNDPDTRRSKTGYVVTVAGGAAAWQTKSQKSVALSSCEAEFYALCEASKEVMWVSSFLTELGVKFDTPVIYCDNQGAAALARNPVGHQRSKHIDIRYFFIREAIANEVLKVDYVATTDNVADIFTKATVAVIFHKHAAVIISVVEK